MERGSGKAKRAEEDLGGVWNTRLSSYIRAPRDIYPNQATILRHCLDTRISRHVYKDPRDKLRMAAAQPHAFSSMGVRRTLVQLPSELTNSTAPDVSLLQEDVLL
ncbi:hypothetical protein V1477_002562 [Vespula maculifrons]|uniref:Uncharacterized protein n=1 Tax=Vespula maculifrons TaxID=7453 RepID=A0ABD2CWV1_VESMC